MLKTAQSNKSAIPRPLRFYDPELQEAWNAEPFDPVRLEKARSRARQLQDSYLKSVQSLAPRMSKRTYRRFAEPSQPLFDADLLEFAFGDSIGVSSKRPRSSPALTVRALFRSFDSKTLHSVTYKQIASLNVNIPTARWFEWGRGDARIDSLLSDELIDVNGVLMEHTYLFVSGTVISIQFASVIWETTRAQ